MSDTTFYTIGSALASGIFIRSFFDIGWSGVALVGVIGIALLLAWRVSGAIAGSPLLILAVASIAFTAGVARLQVSEDGVSPLAAHENAEVILEGRVTREPDVREMNVHLYVEVVLEGGQEEMVLVTTNRFGVEVASLAYGDRVRAEGKLTVPEAFATDGGRTFDYPGYLRARGVTHTLPFAQVELVERAEPSLIGSLYRGKHTFMEALERAVPEPSAGLGEGVLLGVKRALGDDLELTFRKTGIIHIVVLSGYNVMIIVVALTYLLSFFFCPRTRMVLGITGIATFALLVGLSATVVRASVMAALLLVARATGRTYQVLRALILAGALMLMVNPYLLVHDPGFQLSFLATVGLILLSPAITAHLHRVPKAGGAREFTTATIATQLFVLPLLLYQTGMFSLVALLVNVLVLPMVPIAMLLTFVTGIAGLVSSGLGLAVGFLAHLSLGYIITIAEFFGSLPFASFSVGAFPFALVVVAYVGIGLVTWHLQKKKSDRAAAVNEYADWTIVEEKEIAPGARSAPGELPFR